ncbi:oxidoreductase [Lactococcus cremoris subsp. cremoris IBB477]|uniref:Oxidoreductase n=1 Tax=Lactococcus cremoris subsp. cremoris IBB477 TaxID=1449093 RepID=A0A1E7G5X1_LACLC|nr:Gfo/Idh/MocA family oxidoreductase [Lactococcus cremoris]MCT0456963.1 gfo/Idh/MocA family oxidoreductase [Lactococcus cremoris]OEU40333.1 oxidoreductase [Lactococcus cremoris subsp. cremoris IBB477]
MIIGVIGATSNIASKAYLPVYAKMQEEHRFILYSRQWDKAEKVRKQYKFEYATEDLSALETVDLVIIHAATSQHFELAKRYLTAGVPVLMDKPISENFSEVKELQKLARQKNVLFVVAFNRRFAPQTAKLKDLPEKNMVKVSKNLANSASDKITFSMYDIFIHPLDTLIYLLDDEILEVNYSLKKNKKGLLTRAIVMLETAMTSGIATMNLEAGAFTEEFIVESPNATLRLSELTELEKMAGIDRQKFGISGWQSATYNRGFDEIISAMTQAVEKFDGQNREELLTELKQKNILKSHEIIAQMLS